MQIVYKGVAFDVAKVDRLVRMDVLSDDGREIIGTRIVLDVTCLPKPAETP